MMSSSLCYERVYTEIAPRSITPRPPTIESQYAYQLHVLAYKIVNELPIVAASSACVQVVE